MIFSIYNGFAGQGGGRMEKDALQRSGAGSITLRQLAVFRCVAEEGGMTRAAERLRTAQPAVSLSVRELERALGTVLFDRVSHRVVLTDDGRKLLDYARRVLDLMGDMRRDMADPEHAVLAVGSSITAGTRLLPVAARRLRREHPRLELRVRVADSAAVERGVLDGALDVGLIEGLAHDPRIEGEPVLADRLAVVCAPGYAWAGASGAAAGLPRRRIALGELLAQPLILREQGSGVRERFDAALTAAGRAAEPVWETVSTGAALAAAREGLGLAVLPELLVRAEVRTGSLAEVDVEGLALDRELLLIRRGDRHRPWAVDALSQAVRDCAAELSSL